MYKPKGPARVMSTHRSQKRYRLQGAIAATFALCACSADSRSPHALDDSRTDTLEPQEVSATTESLLEGTGEEAFTGDHFWQHYGVYGDNVSTANAGLLWIWNGEADPATDDEYSYVHTVSAAYDIVRVVPRCANDFFVHGRYDALDIEVIERWQVRMPNGAWDAQRPQSNAPLGTPVPGYNPAIESIVGGGSFLPPDDRTTSPTVIRTLILRLPSGQSLATLTPDPDGRFILYSDGSIVRQMVIGASHPTVIAGSTNLYLGVHSITQIVLNQSAAVGRHVVIDAGDYDYKALLIDDANDGNFEGTLEMDWDAYIGDFAPNTLQDLIF